MILSIKRLKRCWSDCADAQAGLRHCCSSTNEDRFSLPLNHSRRFVVSYMRKYVHEVLVNCLFKLAQEKSVVSWTDRPAMTIAVDLGRKATKQKKKKKRRQVFSPRGPHNNSFLPLSCWNLRAYMTYKYNFFSDEEQTQPVITPIWIGLIIASVASKNID